ncbi:MAG: hypothetical protein M1812_002474 [Candelaria pacifica]|nr:MAG: hypothetical protein M1812_002474 [Candelaria pacifica]
MAAGRRLRLKPKGGKMALDATGVPSSQGMGVLGAGLGMSYVQMPQVSPSNFGEAISSPFDELNHSPMTYRPSPLSPAAASGRRRSSKGMAPAIVKRSASTPNVRGLAAADAAGLSMSAAEKRRNKLGYHRTSDPQGRCTNCIRLKKECNFFPVDQQPQPDRRPRTESKAEGTSGDGSNSESSSPARASTQGAARTGDFSPYPPLPLNQVQDLGAPNDPLSASSSSPIGKGWRFPLESTFRRPHLAQIHTAPSVPRPFDFTQGAERAPMWNQAPFFDRSPAVGPEIPQPAHPSSSFWKLAETPVNQSLHSLHSQHPRAGSGGSFSLGRSREDIGWPVPARAMSFSQIENLPSQYPNRHNSQDQRHRLEDLYPPSLNTSHASTSTISEPASAPPSSLPMHPFGPSPTWTSFSGPPLSGMVGTSSEGFNGWYSEPSPLSQVREEDGGAHYGGDVSAFFVSNGG